MVQKLQFFDRDLKALVREDLSEVAFRKEFAQFARVNLRNYLREAPEMPTYETIVNSRRGASEDSVVMPGPIIYRFSWLRPIARYALTFLHHRSPRKSGKYQRSHVLLFGNSEIADGNIPPDAGQIVITNRLPYARKIHTGAMKKMSMPPGIYEDAKVAVLRKFGQVVECQVRLLNLPHPWILRRDHGRTGRRKGDPVTYPSLVIDVKD